MLLTKRLSMSIASRMPAPPVARRLILIVPVYRPMLFHVTSGGDLAGWLPIVIGGSRRRMLSRKRPNMESRSSVSECLVDERPVRRPRRVDPRGDFTVGKFECTTCLARHSLHLRVFQQTGKMQRLDRAIACDANKVLKNLGPDAQVLKSSFDCDRHLGSPVPQMNFAAELPDSAEFSVDKASQNRVVGHQNLAAVRLDEGVPHLTEETEATILLLEAQEMLPNLHFLGQQQLSINQVMHVSSP